MNNYQQSGYYLVADGSGEYRSYDQELEQFIEETEVRYYPEDNWFDYDLMPTCGHRRSWCIGKFGSVEGNPNYDPFDGNF